MVGWCYGSLSAVFSYLSAREKDTSTDLLLELAHKVGVWEGGGGGMNSTHTPHTHTHTLTHTHTHSHTHQVSLSPALYARIILEQHSKHTLPPSQPSSSSSSPSTAALVNQWIKNPHTIPEPTLQLHIKTVEL